MVVVVTPEEWTERDKKYADLLARYGVLIKETESFEKWLKWFALGLLGFAYGALVAANVVIWIANS